MVSAKTERFEYIERACKDDFGWLARSYAIMHDFSFLGAPSEEKSIIPLMPLGDSNYVRCPEGGFEECARDELFIDSSGSVYEYLYDLDVAMKLPEYNAMTENGMQVRFEEDNSVYIEVVTEDILDAHNWQVFG